MPESLPLPAGAQASYSPDGQSLAYEPITKWEPAWKRYVGGQTTPIWIVNLKTLDLVKVPRDNSNDSDPVWAGNSVYFLSDRSGPVSLFRYDTGTREVSPVAPNRATTSNPFRPVPAAWSMSNSAPFISIDTATTPTKPLPSRFTANCPTSSRIWPPFGPMKSGMQPLARRRSRRL